MKRALNEVSTFKNGEQSFENHLKDFLVDSKGYVIIRHAFFFVQCLNFQIEKEVFDNYMIPLYLNSNI